MGYLSKRDTDKQTGRYTREKQPFDVNKTKTGAAAVIGNQAMILQLCGGKGNKRLSPRHKFTVEEDERLKALVQSLGVNQWGAVAEQMRERTARQCRERWQNYLAPELDHSPWTEEEEARLIEKVNEYGLSWSLLTRFFQGRSEVYLKNRWTARTRKEQLKTNRINGRLHERIVTEKLERSGWTIIGTQVSIQPEGENFTVRADVMALPPGKEFHGTFDDMWLVELKASDTASFTQNQTTGYPVIAEKGGTILNGQFEGKKIPPNSIQIISDSPAELG